LTAVDELRSLVADLPALALRAETGAVSSSPALVPSSEVPPRGAIFTVMGGHERTGSWIVPRQLKVVVVMGGAEIDLRDARFGAGITEIEVFVLMGGVNIIVPPGVRVESLGAAFMGGFELKAGDATALSPTHPVLRLGGLAIMGGVETETRYPGETAKEAKRRRRRARSAR
jgi:Cell wall-active antibiotics response 4TMS YvqF